MLPFLALLGGGVIAAALAALRRPEELRVTLARNLMAARAAAGMNQDALAQAAGVSRATISELEACATDPKISTVAQIAEALSITPALLLMSPMELQAIVATRDSVLARGVEQELTPENIENLERLVLSGRDRQAKQAAEGAARITQEAARKAAEEPEDTASMSIAAKFAAAPSWQKAAMVGAGIGSLLVPGPASIATIATIAATVAALKEQKAEKPAAPESARSED